MGRPYSRDFAPGRSFRRIEDDRTVRKAPKLYKVGLSSVGRFLWR
jgi:hypothetical protein